MHKELQHYPSLPCTANTEVVLLTCFVCEGVYSHKKMTTQNVFNGGSFHLVFGKDVHSAWGTLDNLLHVRSILGQGVIEISQDRKAPYAGHLEVCEGVVLPLFAFDKQLLEEFIQAHVLALKPDALFASLKYTTVNPRFFIEYPIGADYTTCCFCGRWMEYDAGEAMFEEQFELLAENNKLIDRIDWCQECNHLSLTSRNPCCCLHEGGCGNDVFAPWTIKQITTTQGNVFKGYMVVPPELLHAVLLALANQQRTSAKFLVYCGNCQIETTNDF